VGRSPARFLRGNHGQQLQPAPSPELQDTGDHNATWGVTANSVFDLIEKSIAGLVTVPISDADMTLSHNNGVEDQSRYMMLSFAGALTGPRTVTLQAVSKMYVVANGTTGGFGITLTTGSGTSYLLANGQKRLLFVDGTNIYSNDNLLTLSSALKRWGVIGSVDAAGIMDIGHSIDFHNGDVDATDYAVRLGTTGGALADLYITPTTGGACKIWNDGNDGPASGMDADTADGLHASAFQLAATAPVSKVSFSRHANRRPM
jgi:hypothetical protein